MAKLQSGFLITYWGPTWLSLPFSLAWAGYFMRIQAQDKVTAGRKSSVKLFIGAYIQAMGPNRPTTDSRPKFGGEITSDQPDDYKSRLFATYQGLDGGYKREKSNPHREN